MAFSVEGDWGPHQRTSAPRLSSDRMNENTNTKTEWREQFFGFFGKKKKSRPAVIEMRLRIKVVIKRTTEV